MDIMKLQNGSDVRGIALEGVEGEHVNLTEDVSLKIGFAFVQWLSKKTGKACDELKIGAGRDSRLTGPSLVNALICGFLSAGAKVVNCNLATTPAMFMSIVFKQTKYDGSAMVTASHLPFNRNGIKFFDADGGLEHDDITEILKIASEVNDDFVQNAKKNFNTEVESFNLLDIYAEHLKNKIKEGISSEQEKPLSGLHIVVDSGNGASGFFVDKILKPLGADTTGSQFLEPDGKFPNHIPNPENKEAMEAIRSAVLKNKADLGLIFDTAKIGFFFNENLLQRKNTARNMSNSPIHIVSAWVLEQQMTLMRWTVKQQKNGKKSKLRSYGYHDIFGNF